MTAPGRTWWVWGVCCLLAAGPARGGDLAAYDLPGLAWGMAPEAIAGLGTPSGPGHCAVHPGAPGRILGLAVEEVRCCFHEGGLLRVELSLAAGPGGAAPEEALTTRLGPPAPADNVLCASYGGTAWLGETAVHLLPLEGGRPTLWLMRWEGNPMRAFLEATAAQSRAAREYQALWERHRDWAVVDPAFAAWMRSRPDTARLKYSLQPDGALVLDSPEAGLFVVDARNLPPRDPEGIRREHELREAARREQEARHLQVAARLDELGVLVGEGLPGREENSRQRVESTCNLRCVRELGEELQRRHGRAMAEFPAPAWLDDCRQACVQALNADLDATCQRNEEAALAFLAEHGAHLRELWQGLGTISGKGQFSRHRLRKPLAALRRVCPARAARIEERLSEVLTPRRPPPPGPEARSQDRDAR